MPYIIIMALPFSRSPFWTVVGDQHSDPELMASLNAVLDKKVPDKNYNRYYRTPLNSRQVLDRLEVEGYKVVGMQTIAVQYYYNDYGTVTESVSHWTLHKPNMIPLLPLYDFPISERIAEI